MRYHRRTPAEIKEYEKKTKDTIRKVLFIDAHTGDVPEGTPLLWIGTKELPEIGDVIQFQTGIDWEWTAWKVAGISAPESFPDRLVIRVTPTEMPEEVESEDLTEDGK